MAPLLAVSGVRCQDTETKGVMMVCSSCGESKAMYCAYCLAKKSAKITDLEVKLDVKTEDNKKLSQTITSLQDQVKRLKARREIS
jgi:hypothetical protein